MRRSNLETKPNKTGEPMRSICNKCKTGISVRTNKSNVSNLDTGTAVRAGNLQGSSFPSTGRKRNFGGVAGGGGGGGRRGGGRGEGKDEVEEGEEDKVDEEKGG